MRIKEELAWAAGFFDGEGCTNCSTRTNGKSTKRYRLLRMIVSQSEPTTLERFQAAVGFGRIEGPHHCPSHPPNAKPKWQYKVDGLDKVQALALFLWPWLSEPKRQQIEVAFEKYRGWTPSA